MVDVRQRQDLGRRLLALRLQGGVAALPAGVPMPRGQPQHLPAVRPGRGGLPSPSDGVHGRVGGAVLPNLQDVGRFLVVIATLWRSS